MVGTQCGLFAPFVRGSGVTFAQAIQNSIESILSVIPGYNGPLPSAATTDPEAVLTASSAPQTVAGKALAASSAPVDESSVDGRAHHTRSAASAGVEDRGEEVSQEPAANAPARKRQRGRRGQRQQHGEAAWHSEIGR